MLMTNLYYYVNFFFKKNWDISEEIIRKLSGKNLAAYLRELSKYIQRNFNYKTIHLGLGELLEKESERYFVKDKLIPNFVNLFFLD